MIVIVVARRNGESRLLIYQPVLTCFGNVAIPSQLESLIRARAQLVGTANCRRSGRWKLQQDANCVCAQGHGSSNVPQGQAMGILGPAIFPMLTAISERKASEPKPPRVTRCTRRKESRPLSFAGASQGAHA